MLKKRLLAAAMVLLTLCAGCAQADNTAPKEDAVSFIDALGREVTVEGKPERVAALIGSFADVWQLAGGTVCAAPEDAWEDLGLELGDAANIGGAHSPNVEALLAAEPELVLASASTSEDVELQELLDNAGVTTAYFDVDCFEDYLDMLDICTDITGRKDLFESNGTRIKEQIDDVKDEFSKSGLTEEQKTVLIIRTSASSVKAKGSEGTVLGEMLSDLGCINIADSDETLLEALSAESVMRAQPYRIFVVTMGEDTDKAMENLSLVMDEDPAWGSLAAVRENRMHVMDRKLFNNKPNARWAEAYELLSKILREE